MIKLKHLLEEAYFHVPRSVYQEIHDYAMEMYRKYKLSGTKRVTDESFPPKVFKLNVKGTQWEFLEPIIKPVKIQFTSGNNSSFYSNQLGNVPAIISLNLRNTLFIDEIEHEILHHIQYTIQNYKLKKDKITRPFGYKPSLGGLPPKQFMPSDITVHGYKKDSIGKKRVSHTNRPIEYYPDLLTVIRYLQFWFAVDMVKKEPSHKFFEFADYLKWWKTIESDQQKKKEYFSNFIKGLSDKENFNATHDTFIKFKNQGTEFFKLMVKLAYDAFVNKPWNFNPLELRKTFDDIKKIIEKQKLQKQESGQSEFMFNKDRLYVYSDGALFDFVDYSKIPIEDGLTSSTWSIFGELGIRETVKGTYNLSIKRDGIRRLFSKFKKMKDIGNTYDLQLSDNKEFTPDMIKELYDSIFSYLKTKYLNALIAKIDEYDLKRKELETFINQFYS
jgi:hypothetical protein